LTLDYLRYLGIINIVNIARVSIVAFAHGREVTIRRDEAPATKSG
jgi:hypothetical protein